MASAPFQQTTARSWPAWDNHLPTEIRNILHASLMPEAPPAIPASNARSPSDPGVHRGKDETLAVLLPIIILLASLLFLLLLSLVVLLCARRHRGSIRLSERGNRPTDLADDEELVHGSGGIEGLESRWLDSVSEPTKLGYIRAKAWQAQFPPNSQPTDITLTQFLSIQEKGVSAWCFEADYDNLNPPFLVTGRTEIDFLADGMGMASEEGGGSCVQSNLPIPKMNEVYYFEAKLFEKPESTNLSIGLATKPYPSFRLPGWNKYSIGYFSADGFKSYNYPFTATSYGQPLYEGDVLGVGYRPRSGTVFFTRNGKRLEDAYVGFNKHNVFPTIGSDGPAVVHVNLGQSGFVFIEANVKKWGLAPSSGTLAPPPAYGSEGGSVLLETSGAQRDRQRQDQGQQDESGSLPRSFRTRRRSSGRRRHRHARVESFDGQPSQQEDAIPEEPEQYFSSSNASSRRLTPAEEVNEEDLQSHNPHNPPTPNMLDISLHSLRQPSNRPRSPSSDDSAVSSSGSSDGAASPRPPSPNRTGDPAPPAYHIVDPVTYAPGVAEAMLGESFAQFQAMQNGTSPSGSFGSSLPSSAQYEGGSNYHGQSGEPSIAARVARLARNTVNSRPRPQQIQQSHFSQPLSP